MSGFGNMLISYYQEGVAAPKRASPGIAALIVANAAFAFLIVFAWTYVSLFVAEPLAWATWMPISRGYGVTGLLDYPFVMLWIVPLFGILGSWLSLKGGNKVMAYAFVGVPLVMLALILGWFYAVPGDWH